MSAGLAAGKTVGDPGDGGLGRWWGPPMVTVVKVMVNVMVNVMVKQTVMEIVPTC